MLRRQLGRTSIEVTELGFGAAPIGNLHSAITDEAAAATVQAAWDGGIRYFDTAPHYGLGLSERRLGAALAGRPRESFVVSTKVGRLLVDNPAPTGSDLAAGGFDVPDSVIRERDYSADGVRRSLDSSLRRLGLDRVDIALVHDPEDFMDDALNGAIPALVELREQGVIGAVGAGMNFWPPLLRLVNESDVDVVMVAGRWTLADRSAAPMLAACLDRNVSVLAAAPFNSGLLARPWPPDGALFDYAPASPELLHRARRLAKTCQRYDEQLPHAAMRFPLRHPAVASVVAGMRTDVHVRGNVDWAEHDLPGDLWKDLDAIVTAP
ncbi:MAG TPA: aldo/keto reductase [Jatrophihabitantaceae bacterium]|nr:aldo/keto reductase [Jatrophihabitantaceae bacterium]